MARCDFPLGARITSCSPGPFRNIMGFTRYWSKPGLGDDAFELLFYLSNNFFFFWFFLIAYCWVFFYLFFDDRAAWAGGRHRITVRCQRQPRFHFDGIKNN
ncbi:hypothetical protein K432DRAFT_111913 [Lepidopterella palustris CBS 459.81]|uniref:Uncharacterized protein n=1 Tax=Lepidopterella palustris CBS 459.81 TaxID=1314670 RepID=A0A8E2EIE7_9PEZI|nr:hypothetical protein K432DRAFT_111913 [Lepidopterella palustris CBS 459.81]